MSPLDSPSLETSMSGPGAALLYLLRGLPREGAERSFKLSAASLLADRFLIGVHKSDIAPGTLYGLCERLGMPGAFLAGLRSQAPAANAFHFGYEGRGMRGLYKVYLEFASRLHSAPPGPVLLHLAYKWDCSDAAPGAIAKYVCHPGLDLHAILDRMRKLCAGLASQGGFDVAAEIVERAARRAPKPLMYLEVREEGNPRASYDIKLHDADMRVGEVAPLLAQLGTHYAIRASELGSLLEGARSARLGHLSGGISRESTDFLTIYHAADGL